jgi:hypothetical protein
VLAALTAISESVGDEVRRRWAAHRSPDLPLLVLFGPHNAGKTSLLQRLLVDDDLPVPPGLLVGARPEETSGEVVTWRGWRILDVPGLGSEQEQHDAIAWEVIELADAVVVVMSLKLLTGEGLEVTAVLDGSWWTGSTTPVRWPVGALHVVVARIDAGHADPADDPEELEDLKDELAPQVDALLRGAEPEPSVSWVAPSPNGILRSGHAPEATLAASREWDGMAELEERLAAAASDVPQLRAAALVRYLHRTAHAVGDELTTELADLEQRRGAAQAAQAHERTIDQQVDAALAATEAKARAVVLECFSAVVDSGAGDPESAVRTELARRADAVEQEFRRDVDALVVNLQHVLDAMPDFAVAPSQRWSAPRAQRAKKGGQSIPWGKASTNIRKLAREGVELKLDNTITVTKGKLKTLDNKEGEALAKALEKAGFSSETDAKAARDLIKKYDGAMKVLGTLPQLIELVGIFREAKRGRDQARRVTQLESRQEQLVSTIAAALLHGPRGFRARLERVRLVARESLPAAENLSELEAATARLHDWQAELSSALVELG